MERELPESWILGTIDQVCTHPQYGWTCKAQSQGNLKLLRTTDITSGSIDWDTVPFCSETPKKEEDYYLQDGDIVVSRAGSVGKSFIIKGMPPKAVFASYLVRFKPHIEKYYIYYFMQSRLYWSQIEEKSAGIAVPNVNGSKLAKISLPIAPLNEQKRIVDRIEQLFSDMDKGEELLKTVQKQLATYRQSVLKAAVTGELTKDWREKNKKKLESGEKLLARILESRRKNWKIRGQYQEPEEPKDKSFSEIPLSWAIATIDQISSTVDYGTSAKCSTDSSGVTVLRMGNIQNGTLDLEKLKYLPKNHDEFPKLLLEEGDLLFNRTNSAELVGKTTVYKSKPKKCSFASYLIRVKLIDVEPDYVSAFINSAFGRSWVKSVVSQQVGQANVNGTKLKALSIPLPPKSEQEEIVQRLENIFSQIDVFESLCTAELKRSNTLRQALLKSAFSGKLVAQDSADEPASELLTRIKSGDGVKTKAKAATPRRGRKPRSDKSEAA